MAFRKQVMNIEYAHCPWSVISCKPSQWTKLENMFVYVIWHIYIHTYIHIYIYIYKLYSFGVYLSFYICWQIHPGIFNKFSSIGLSLFSYPHFLKIFIYYLFVAVLGLCCCTRASSSCRLEATLWLWNAGFSLWWLLLLQLACSRVCGLSGWGAWA